MKYFRVIALDNSAVESFSKSNCGNFVASGNASAWAWQQICHSITTFMKKKQIKKTSKKALPKTKATNLTLIGKKNNTCYAKMELANLPKLTEKQARRIAEWLDMVKVVVLENRHEWTEKVATFRLMRL